MYHLQELRVEDYLANRKGKHVVISVAPPVFGFGTTPVVTSAPVGFGFLQSKSLASFQAQSVLIFGQNVMPTSATLRVGFGQNKSAGTGLSSKWIKIRHFFKPKTADIFLTFPKTFVVRASLLLTVAPDKVICFNQKVLLFFLFIHKNMFWALIRSASVRHF